MALRRGRNRGRSGGDRRTSRGPTMADAQAALAAERAAAAATAQAAQDARLQKFWSDAEVIARRDLLVEGIEEWCDRLGFEFLRMGEITTHFNTVFWVTDTPLGDMLYAQLIHGSNRIQVTTHHPAGLPLDSLADFARSQQAIDRDREHWNSY